MTSNGASAPLDAFAPVDASVACRLMGNACIQSAPEDPSREILARCGGGNWTEDWAEYRWLAFARPAHACTLRLRGRGTVRLLVSGLGRIGESAFDSPDVFADVTVSLVRPVTGRVAVWVLFDGTDIALESFRFQD